MLNHCHRNRNNTELAILHLMLSTPQSRIFLFYHNSKDLHLHVLVLSYHYIHDLKEQEQPMAHIHCSLSCHPSIQVQNIWQPPRHRELQTP